MIAALLALAAVAAAPPPPVPVVEHVPTVHTAWIEGTRWSYDPADGWSLAELDALRALGPRLPAAWRDPGVAVRFRLDDAAPLTDGDSHTLARIHPLAPVVTLDVRGLADRLAEGRLAERLGDPAALAEAARILLQRAAVHELTHLVDRRRGLSAGRAWRDLSGWRPWARVVNRFTPHAAPEFAAPWGARSPEEDLATFAEVYFLPPPLGPYDAEDAAVCRFPQKYAFLHERFGDPPAAGPRVVCSGPADVGLAPEQVGDVHVLFATPALTQAATLGGHLLLAVELRDGGASRWETFALVADSAGRPAESIETILFGLLGGFPSRVERHPYEATRLRYVEAQRRDLLRYRWRLTDTEKARLLARLDDLSLHWRRPYLFLHQNCSALVVELARAVDPAPIPDPGIVAPDLVLSELVRRGRLEPLPPDPTRDLARPEGLSTPATPRGDPRDGGRAAQHSPYAPVTTGVLVRDAADPVAMAFVRRAALDIVAGQPRLFPPASGLDLRLLDARVAVGAWPTPALVVSADVLAFAWQPARDRGPAPLLRLHALTAEHEPLLGRGWVRWAGAEGGLTLARSASGGSRLDVTLGAEVHTALDASAGTLRARPWFVAPLAVHGFAHTRATPELGVEASVRALPALSGANRAVALEAEAHAWLFLGRVRMTGVKLTLGARHAWHLSGAIEQPPSNAELGLRFERR